MQQGDQKGANGSRQTAQGRQQADGGLPAMLDGALDATATSGQRRSHGRSGLQVGCKKLKGIPNRDGAPQPCLRFGPLPHHHWARQQSSTSTTAFSLPQSRQSLCLNTPYCSLRLEANAQHICTGSSRFWVPFRQPPRLLDHLVAPVAVGHHLVAARLERALYHSSCRPQPSSTEFEPYPPSAPPLVYPVPPSEPSHRRRSLPRSHGRPSRPQDVQSFQPGVHRR